MIAIALNWEGSESQITFGQSDTSAYTGDLTTHATSTTLTDYWALDAISSFGTQSYSDTPRSAIFSTSTSMILLPEVTYTTFIKDLKSDSYYGDWDCDTDLYCTSTTECGYFVY